MKPPLSLPVPRYKTRITFVSKWPNWMVIYYAYSWYLKYTNTNSAAQDTLPIFKTDLYRYDKCIGRFTLKWAVFMPPDHHTILQNVLPMSTSMRFAEICECISHEQSMILKLNPSQDLSILHLRAQDRWLHVSSGWTIPPGSAFPFVQLKKRCSATKKKTNHTWWSEPICQYSICICICPTGSKD